MAVSQPWKQAFIEHYHRHFGQPNDHSVYGSESGSAIEVLRYTRADPSHTLLLTAGLSEYADAVGSITEVAFAVDDHADELSDFLVRAVMFAGSEQLPIEAGYSIQGLAATNAQLASSTGKEALYFTRAQGIPPEAEIVTHDGETGRLLSAILVTEAENTHFIEHGAAEFESKLAASGADILQVKRPSCV